MKRSKKDLKMDRAILTLCIPTYNRGAALKGNIEIIAEQLKEIRDGEVEFIVSDNCSTDNTLEVVNHFIDAGIPIILNKNESNLGSTGNFLKCINLATGKYVLLLGDDDYLAPGALKYLLKCLNNKDYGLLHIDVHSPIEYPLTEFDDINDYLKKINRQLTWMSGNIFRKEIVEKVGDPTRYMNSYLLQMPFFLTSALEYSNNAITGERIIEMDAGKKFKVLNGGERYGFIKVFANNFLGILSDCFKKYDGVSKNTYSYIKRKMFEDWISKKLYKCLFSKRRDLFSNWFYAFKCYGLSGYFYKSLFGAKLK